MEIITTRERDRVGSRKAWKILGFLCTLAMLIPCIGVSQWSSDPKVNRLISNATNDQINTASVSDGSGGAIIVWQDKRSGSYDIYAQRVNASGVVQWSANGVSVCSVDSDQVRPAITSDGAGGAIIAWQDKRNGSYDIYAQRVTANGTLLWSPSTGDSICKVVFDQVNIAMVSDDNGGALLTWEDYRSNAGPGLADIYVQKVNALGVTQWIPNGIGVCTQAAGQHGPRIINDGAGGAYLTWYDQRAGDYDIYAQRVTTVGGLVGIANGVAVCTSGTDQTNPDICTDGSGGAIIVWQDFRSTTSIDIWVQAMSAAVAIRWPVDGVVMNNNVAYDQINPKIVTDGAGGAMMMWEDFRTGITSDIYAQRVAATGVVATGWNVNGVAVCVSAENQSGARIISDSSHGAIITWVDKRDSSTNGNATDIYASRITGNFALPWSANGVPISTADSTQTNPTVVSDGRGGAIIAWQDKRSGNYDIYASRVYPGGTTSVELVGSAPAEFTLSQNYPNPFNPSTTIRFQIPQSGRVSLKVFDVLGREVATLLNEEKSAGSFSVRWNAATAGTGTYFARLESNGKTQMMKMMLVK